jgi:hypothetical protein
MKNGVLPPPKPLSPARSNRVRSIPYTSVILRTYKVAFPAKTPHNSITMFLALRTNRKARILLTVGLLSLSLALSSYALNLTWGLAPNPLHFFRGFFLGVSIVLNIAALTQIAKEDRARRPHQS